MKILEVDTEQINYNQIDKWLIEYKKSRNKYRKSKYKTLIATTMLPIIKRIAKTIARRSYDPVEDMVQAGAIGLLKAIDTYVINSGVDFRIYAGRVIIGEMKHFLRDKLNAIRVPRHIQELLYRINTFTSSLTAEELYDLTSYEVSLALNVPQNAIDYALEADRRTSIISLEELYGANQNDNMGYEEVISKDDYKETSEIEDAKLIFKTVIEKLPEDYKTVVELYYYRDMNQKEIADELNLTRMGVSRRLKKAFGILHKMIANKTSEVEAED